MIDGSGRGELLTATGAGRSSWTNGRLLGPARCRGCGRAVWWGRTGPGHAVAWRDDDGAIHRCPPPGMTVDP